MDWLAWKEKVLGFWGKYRYFLLVLLVGLVLMLLPEKGERTGAPEMPAEETEVVTMEQRLEAILGQIEGAGKVRVMLTEDTGEYRTYQTDDDLTDTQDSVTARHDTVIVTDADRAQQGLLCRVDPPEYRGAVIVCQGADQAGIRLAIVQAVSNVTGLGADRISVLKMK